MHHLQKKGLVALSLAALILVGVATYLAWLNFSSPVLAARDGVIDGRGISPEKGPYLLTGQWLRVPGLHEPNTMVPGQGEYVEDIRYIRKMRGYTYAFSLEVDNSTNLCFLLPRPHNSRLWLNGEEVLGEDGAPITSVDVFRLNDYLGAASNRADFVLQVSSSSIYDVYQGLLVGGRTLLSSTQTRWLMLDLIAVGLYLMLCVLMLALYFPKRSEIYLPILTLSALSELAHFLLITRHPMMDFFHLGTTVFYRQFNCLSYFICKLLVCEEGDVPKWMDWAVYGAVTATAVGCLALPEQAALILRLSFFLYLALQLYLLGKGALKGRRGAPVLLFGWAVVTGNEIFYTLLNLGLFPQGMVDVQIMPAQYARLAYVLAFAVATCQKFAHKFRQADRLATDLERQVSLRTEELRQANTRLLEVQSQRQHFMTDMVHNLRSPLFVLNGYTDFLAEEKPNLSEAGQRYLGQMDEKLTYLGSMVDDLFFISRLEDGQIRFHFTQFDLQALLSACVQDGEVRRGDKQVMLALECPPLLMVGDQFHLKQAVDNLLDNAIRHSSPEGTITVSAGQEQEWVTVTVADEGGGIAPEQMGKLFERYASKGVGGSTGLGLSICKQIVERHGGSIRMESALGKGSIIYFRLPLSPADIGDDFDKK